MPVEAVHRVGQQAQAVERVQRDQRLVDVQLELPLAGCESDRRVVSHHLRADHRQRLDLGRVDLARHDRTAGFILGKTQLAQPGTRPAAHQADVAADLGQCDRQHLQRRMKGDQRLVAGHRRKQVVRLNERQVELARQQGRHPRAEFRVCVQTGTDRRASDRQRMHRHQRMAKRLLAQRELGFVAAELLAQRHRRRILQVGSADLHDEVERDRLGGQRGAQFSQCRQQPIACLQGHRQVHGCREHIVRRLPEVHVVVRVNRARGGRRGVHPADFTARERLRCQMSHNLVDVHVRLRARTGLPHRQREVSIELACCDTQRRIGDGLRAGLAEQAQVAVDASRRPLDPGHRVDQRQRHALLADRKEAQAALRLCAPQRFGRHVDGAEAVVFDAGRTHARPLRTELRLADRPAPETAGITDARDGRAHPGRSVGQPPRRRRLPAASPSWCRPRPSTPPSAA